MSKISKATFSVSGKIHKRKFDNYDVWEKRISDVIKGEKQEPKTVFAITRKEYKPHHGYNVMVGENVEVSTHETLDIAEAEAARLQSRV